MKFITVFFILSSLFSIHTTHAAWYDDCSLQSFKATAYYSPVPGQKFYVKGSLEEDKILNGNGTHGASGKAVFNGMIAAPKKYAFGTRIYVPNRGVGQIEDRGGAIVEAGERNEPFDRLDFWAGVGDAGLQAALRFGVRYFDAYVCPVGMGGNELGFSFADIPLKRKTALTLREVDLSPGSTSNWTPVLQKYLKVLGFLEDVPETNYYGEKTTKAVCDYQQHYMGMKASNQWCGRFGKLTRTSLEKTLKANNGTVKENSVKKQLPTQLTTQSKHSDKNGFGLMKPGDEGEAIKQLQRKLQGLGYYPFDRDITGVYDTITIRAVYVFQLENDLLAAESSPSLYGRVGPKTRDKLNSL